jgi:hypothetical protein
MGTYMSRLRRRLSRDERGMQTVEWVGLGGGVTALIGAVIAALGPVGEAVVEAIQALLDAIRFQPITPPFP